MLEYLYNKFDINSVDLVSTYDELPLWSAPFGLTLLETVRMRQSINVLDIGCGTGFPLLELAQRLGNSSKIYGIDPWEKAIDRIRQKMKVYNIQNVSVTTGMAENMSFPQNFFDIIVSNNGVNNVSDANGVINKCFDMLKKGGQFVFTMNTPTTMHEFYEVYEETLNELSMHEEIDKMKEHILTKRKPTEYTIEQLRKAGFKVRNAIEKSFSIRCVNGTAFLNHYFIRLAFLDSWKTIVYQSDREEVFTLLEDKLNKLATRIGELQLTIPYVCFDAVKS